MSGQYALFGDDEPSHGETLKDEGIAKALSKSGLNEWQDKVKAWTWARNAGARFTSEDIIEEFGLPTGQVGTNKNNAVGAIMNAIAKKGVIRNTGDYVKSSRPSSHSAVIAVWERTQLGKESRASKLDPDPVHAHSLCATCGEPNGAHLAGCNQFVHTCHPSGLHFDPLCAACNIEARS